MRVALTIARYDLLRSAKQRETFLIGLLMPVLMIVLLGVAMGGADDVAIRIDVIDADGSALSRQFVALLAGEMRESGAGEQAFYLCTYRRYAEGGDLGDDCDLDRGGGPDDWRATANERLEDTDTYGAIIIPAGFGEALRAGESVTVVFKRSDELSAPTLAEQKVDAAVSRMGGAVAIANLVVGVAQAEFEGVDPGDRPATFDRVRQQVEVAWDDRPIRIASTATGGTPTLVGFNQSGPGIATMFVLISMLNAATLLVYEREQGTLQRLYTLPHRKWQILGGKLLGHYAYGLVQYALLILFGVFVGVEWGDNLPGIALVVLAFTLAATAIGMAMATLVRTSAQASSIALLLGLTLSPLGGAWWPLEIVPDVMRTVGHVSPVAWAMDAFQEMMFYGGGVIDILPMLGALLLMAALFFAFGVLNFKYE